MVNPPESHQSKAEQEPSGGEWREFDALVEGIADSEYLVKLHEYRRLDEEFIKEFRTVLDVVASESGESSKDDEAKAIRNFFCEKLDSGESLSCQQLATVLYELKNRGDDEGVVEVFEAGIPAGIDESAVLKEFYAVSLNKIGRLEDSITVLEDLMSDETARVGEVAGILGKVRKLQSKEARSEEQKVEYMRQSIAVLQEGFYSTYEFYPGINLVYNQVELAKMTGDTSLITQAFNDAELVMFAAKKAGAERTSDYWTAATLLESSIFAGEATPTMVRQCLETSKNAWELEATISNLKSVAVAISEQLEAGLLTPDVAERLRKVLETIRGINDDQGIIGALEGTSRLDEEPGKEASDALLENGFMYGETTTLIGGNIQFGGQLQAHVVNRFDVRVAHAIMEHFNIDAIATIEEFNSVIDGIIRKQFGTAELEDLHSESHKIYDTQIKNILSALGISDEIDKSLVDSRTNVMVDFLLGKGDCRQHAHAKQLLFDAWKTYRLNNLISVLKDAQSTPGEIDDENARAQINELLSRQMMVFDSVIESKIQMNDLYDPKYEDGIYVESDEFEAVEDHTWNGIITLDESGKVVSLEMADSFYQDEYGLGGRGQIIEQPISYTEEGMVVTEIMALGKDGVKKKVPVRLKPTKYAGSRGKRMLTHADVGAAHLRGVELGYDVPEIAVMFSSLKISELWRLMAQGAESK